MTNSRSFQFRDDVCNYCDFEGFIIVFENEDSEQVCVCFGCLEAALEEFNNEDLALRA
jgi:hypothetical protein